MNREILVGSVIVGIAAMMLMASMAPAFAASPWKDRWNCVNSGASTIIAGTEEYVKGQGDCASQPASLLLCDPPGPSVDGHQIFQDRDGNGINTDTEKIRCVKN